MTTPRPAAESMDGRADPLSQASPGAALSCRQLTKRFAGHVAVNGLTLDVGRGELFGIVGPDGAGKTTTLRMFAGVLRPTAGDAWIFGNSVAGTPERVKQDIAYMSQRFGLYEDLTVRENLTFYADLYRVPRSDRPARLERLYQFSNLGAFEHRLAGQLSGGMKQKLSLSCALIHQPRLLLLDEPTFGVDPISRRDLWSILQDRIADGVTIVVTTSYLDEAERCHRVAMLNQGTSIALDSPAALQATLAGRVVAVRAQPAFAARDVLRAQPGVATTALFGDTLHVVLHDRESADMIGSALANADIALESVEPIEASLEDVFIHLATGAPA